MMSALFFAALIRLYEHFLRERAPGDYEQLSSGSEGGL